MSEKNEYFQQKEPLNRCRQMYRIWRSVVWQKTFRLLSEGHTWNNLPLTSAAKPCQHTHRKHWKLTDTFGDQIYNKSTEYRALCFYGTIPDISDSICCTVTEDSIFAVVLTFTSTLKFFCVCVSTTMGSLYKLTWLMSGTNCSEKEISDTFAFPGS